MLFPNPQSTGHAEERLGQLAMHFRAANSDQERREIADNYRRTVEQLIQSDLWDEMPASEDQLPDEYMPPSFRDYWLQRK